MIMLQKMNLFVSDFIKHINLNSINIVVFASNTGFVFTFVLMRNGGVWGLKECCGVTSNWHLTFHMRIQS